MSPAEVAAALRLGDPVVLPNGSLVVAMVRDGLHRGRVWQPGPGRYPMSLSAPPERPKYRGGVFPADVVEVLWLAPHALPFERWRSKWNAK